MSVTKVMEDPERSKSKWGVALVICGKFAGPAFVFLVIALLYYVAIWHMVPEMKEDDIMTPSLFLLIGHYLIAMVVIHLVLFMYFTKYNHVSHWQRQACVADLVRQSKDFQDVDAGQTFVMEDEPVSRYCVECNLNSPIRSHHCPICKMCVLRKDHHCFVTGHCVGLGNQRFFITFLFWAMLGLSFFLYFNTSFLAVNPETPEILPFGWVYMIGPIAIVRWIMGYASFFFTCCCVFYSFSICGLISAAAFFSLQVFYVFHGYTMYEYHNLLCRESFGGDGDSASERLRLVFGPFWALNFIFPLVWEAPVLTPEIADNLFRVRSKIL